MGNTFTLDNLRNDLESKYGPVVLEGFPGEGGPIRLLPMLRLSEQRRAEVSEVMTRHQKEARERKAAEDAGDEEAPVDLNASVEQISELLVLVLERKTDIHRIEDAFDGDGQALLMLWERYQEATQPGEASDSED
jgi:tail assembly protein